MITKMLAGLRKILSTMMDRVNDDQAPVTAARAKGKPEPLRGDLAAYWSRRIDREHCLVYRVTQDRIVIAQCRYLY